MIKPIKQEFFNAKDDPSVKVYIRVMNDVKEKCLRALQCENVDEVYRHLEHIESDFDTLDIELEYILSNYQEVIDEYREAMEWFESMEVE